MNDSDQRARYNRSAMQSNEEWYCRTPDDDEDAARKQEQREDIRAQKEEWEWECARDNALTNPKDKIEVKEYGRDLWKHPLTPEELEEIEYQRWRKWDEDYHWNRGY
jgi:hypothetical protein